MGNDERIKKIIIDLKKKFYKEIKDKKLKKTKNNNNIMIPFFVLYRNAFLLHLHLQSN